MDITSCQDFALGINGHPNPIADPTGVPKYVTSLQCGQSNANQPYVCPNMRSWNNVYIGHVGIAIGNINFNLFVYLFLDWVPVSGGI